MGMDTNGARNHVTQYPAAAKPEKKKGQVAPSPTPKK